MEKRSADAFHTTILYVLLRRVFNKRRKKKRVFAVAIVAAFASAAAAAATASTARLSLLECDALHKRYFISFIHSENHWDGNVEFRSTQ